MNGPAPVAGLLLAAGAGRRLGQAKALAHLDGRLLVDLAADTLRAARVDPRVVVLGARADDVRGRADLTGFTVVVNTSWEEGMGGSLRAGLSALSGRAAAVVVTLVDQPLVTAEAIERLIGAWHAGAVAAVATYDGQPANPVLLDASLWDEVSADAVGDVGARPYLRAHPEVVTPVACDGVGRPDDIDTPDDIDSVRRRLQQ